MVLLHPARLLILGNFQAKLVILLLIFEKFQPEGLLHPVSLLDTLEHISTIYTV